MTAQVLVVKPKSLTAADKKLLREAGVVCIEAADPSEVRLLQPEGSVMSGDELFYAAIKAIASDPCNRTSQDFAKTLARMMEQHLSEPTP